MKENFYYETPEDNIFFEVQNEAVAVWQELENSQPSYRKGKIDRVKHMDNQKDNMMYIVAMFDAGNQRKLANKLSPQAREAVRDRIIAGGGEYSAF